MMLRRLVVFLLVCGLISAAEGPPQKRLWILVPVFRVQPAPGNPELGTKVATFLFLQLFTSLRKAPTPNPLKVEFGRGGVTWDGESLPPTNFDEANELARAQAEDPIITFWGDVTEYGDHVFITPRLSIRTDNEVSEITAFPWSVTLVLSGEKSTLKAKLPRTHYEFEPFQLKDDVLADLSQPGGLPLFSGPSVDAPRIGSVGDYFLRTSQQGEFAEVTIPNSSTKGWIRTLSLSRSRVESLPFTAGVLKIFRHDWEGAERDLRNALLAKAVPLPIQVDAQLYFALAFSQTKRHGDAITAAQQAVDQDKFSFPAIQFLALSYLTALIDDGDSAQKTYLEELEKLAYRDVWPRVHCAEDEEWASHLKDIVSRLQSIRSKQKEVRESR